MESMLHGGGKIGYFKEKNRFSPWKKGKNKQIDHIFDFKNRFLPMY